MPCSAADAQLITLGSAVEVRNHTDRPIQIQVTDQSSKGLGGSNKQLSFPHMPSPLWQIVSLPPLDAALGEPGRAHVTVGLSKRSTLARLKVSSTASYLPRVIRPRSAPQTDLLVLFLSRRLQVRPEPGAEAPTHEYSAGKGGHKVRMLVLVLAVLLLVVVLLVLVFVVCLARSS